MDVQHEPGVFFIEVDGARAGEMRYHRVGPTRIVIEHTEVGPALKGKGAGKILLEAAVAWARSENIRVSATCPFAKATFQKHPELQDVYVP
jgi:predicted GNAT family acetyltransferase